jgi:hypothetical protein
MPWGCWLLSPLLLLLVVVYYAAALQPVKLAAAFAVLDVGVADFAASPSQILGLWRVCSSQAVHAWVAKAQSCTAVTVKLHTSVMAVLQALHCCTASRQPLQAIAAAHSALGCVLIAGCSRAMGSACRTIAAASWEQ